jgi:hypothetical protein
MDNDKIEAIQAVVDRVSSYQESAPDGTVEKELREAVGEAGLELSDSEMTALAGAIEKDGGQVSAADVLG